MVETDAFPDAVADQEAGIEHRDLRLVAREELAVDVDLDRGVALVGQRLVGASRHFRLLILAVSGCVARSYHAR